MKTMVFVLIVETSSSSNRPITIYVSLPHQIFIELHDILFGDILNTTKAREKTLMGLIKALGTAWRIHVWSLFCFLR
jgi:hypothetical protein